MSKRYGMIHRERAEAYALHPTDVRATIVAAVAAANVIPVPWPEKTEFYEESFYERESNDPTGCTGNAPTINFLPGREDWIATMDGYGDRMLTLYGQLFLIAAGGNLPEQNFFQRFHSGNAGYDRREWQPGWFDAEKLDAVKASVVQIGDWIEGLLQLLKPDQLPGTDFSRYELREWDAGECGIQETLEYGWLRTDEILPSPAVRLPLTGGSDFLAWESCAAEYIAKAAAANSHIGAISNAGDETGETIQSEVRKCWNLFGHGSQTNTRGI